MAPFRQVQLMPSSASPLPLNDWRTAIERGLTLARPSDRPLLMAALSALGLLAQPQGQALPAELQAPVDLHERAVGAQAQGNHATLQLAWTCAAQAFLVLGAQAQQQTRERPSLQVTDTEGGAIALHVPCDDADDRRRSAVHLQLALLMAKTHTLKLNGAPSTLTMGDVAIADLVEADQPCGVNLVVRWVPRTVVAERLPGRRTWWTRLKDQWAHWSGQDDAIEQLRDGCLNVLSHCLEQTRRAAVQPS